MGTRIISALKEFNQVYNRTKKSRLDENTASKLCKYRN
jgi:hypothetical protein